MAKQVEKEVKTALTLKQYDELCHYFKVDQLHLIEQENYYFDTLNNKLKEHCWGLRIRVMPTKGELTLKKPITRVETLEITDHFSQEESLFYLKTHTFPNGNVQSHLKEINVSMSNLQCIGYLKNERYDIETCDGVFSLDKTYFQSGVTYELEYEYNNSDDQFWELLHQFQIEYTPFSSKMSRAITNQAK